MGRVEFRETGSNYRWEVLKLPLRRVEYQQTQPLYMGCVEFKEKGSKHKWEVLKFMLRGVEKH